MAILSFVRICLYEWRHKRWLKYVRMTAKRCGDNLHVNRPSSINENTYLGNNVNFNGLTVGGHGRISIGDNFHSGTECMIITNTHNYDRGEAIPYDAHDIEREVVIEDNVWIGNRVIILGGTILREGCIIQAGSVVVGEIPYCAIAGGHPAKVFKYRDIAHFEKLKAEGKFM